MEPYFKYVEGINFTQETRNKLDSPNLQYVFNLTSNLPTDYAEFAQYQS